MADPVESFEAFEGEVLNIRRAWELWQLINGYHPYGPDGEVLFDAARTFHWYTSQSLLASVVLGLSRLADPAKDHQGRENLTLERIMDETDFSNRVKGNSPAERPLNKSLEKIQSDKFRIVRNKVLAHNDLKTILGRNASLDTDVIKSAVHAVASFYERIKAVREGKDINHATGEGAFPNPADIQVCEKEISSLIDRLQRSK